MDALKQLKLAKNGYIIMSVIHSPGCLSDYLAGLFDGSFLYSSRDYAYCVWIDKDSGIFSRDIYCLAFQFDLAFWSADGSSRNYYYNNAGT